MVLQFVTFLSLCFVIVNFSYVPLYSHLFIFPDPISSLNFNLICIFPLCLFHLDSILHHPLCMPIIPSLSKLSFPCSHYTCSTTCNIFSYLNLQHSPLAVEIATYTLRAKMTLWPLIILSITSSHCLPLSLQPTIIFSLFLPQVTSRNFSHQHYDLKMKPALWLEDVTCTVTENATNTLKRKCDQHYEEKMRQSLWRGNTTSTMKMICDQHYG